MSITVCPAVASDAATIARFNTLMADETEGIALNQEKIRKGVENLLADSSKGVYYVAMLGERIVGQLMITYEWSDWRNGNFWWIQSVYVEHDARGQGVFKALYDHVYRLATSQPDVCGLRLYVEEQNARAKRTYEKLGMKKTHYELYELVFTSPTSRKDT